MYRKTTLLTCSNPKCGCHYEAALHRQGKAVKIGKLHYCSSSCAKDHTEAIRHGEREEK